MLQNWLQPVQVIVRYFVEEPIGNRITDGLIGATYVHGPRDQIIVEKVKNREYAKYSENLARDYFPKCTGKPFCGFTSGLLYYLRDKMGEDY
jgi:hypothetical protein